MSAHTPGPWVTADAFGPAPDGQCVGEVANGYLVACTTGYFGREGAKANARLIAAAPELLEAARAAMQCIGELPPTQARVEVAQMLQVAIEKATGKQS